MKLKLVSIPDTEQSHSMSAMSDVVFLLLIFFIVTMGAFVKTSFIDTALPKPGSGKSSPQLSKVIQIEVQDDNSEKPELCYRLNGIPHTRQQMQDAIKRFGQLSPDIQIMVRCDNESKHGDLVYLLSQCHNEHLEKVSLLKPK